VSRIQELLRQRRHEELWQMCCGFLDLSLEQFMAIQKRLLLEQIEMLKDCELGRKVMRGAMPETVEEFREQVPLTTYADYCPELLERREDVLPAKPIYWQRTSGRSGEYPFKWAPISQRVWDELGPIMGAGRIFAACREKGDIRMSPKTKLLYASAPAPYTTGIMARKVREDFGLRFLPPLDEAENASFEERVLLGFSMALREGIDGFYGLPGVLIAIGEQFGAIAGTMKLSSFLSQPRVLLRLAKAKMRSKLARRAMLPKDLWKLKGISAMGTDSVIYKDKIKEMWGRRPLNVYGSTEALSIALQTWDYEGMTFVPNLNFLEFIPESEHFKWQLDHSYRPKTVLLDEVKAGENYEVVVTNFHGGAMVRYRVGDIIKITSLKNERLGINIPQMDFERRADDLIDIAGFTRLTEKVVWQAIENTGIPYADWTVRKEVAGNRPVLRLYVELKNGYVATEKGMATAVHEELKKLDAGYADLESIMELRPLEVSFLPEDAFRAFRAKRQAEGADLAHLKPPHINPSDEVLAILKAKAVAVKVAELAARSEKESVATRR